MNTHHSLLTCCSLLGFLLLTSCASMLGRNKDEVTVESFPSEAHVLVEGVHRGKTPLLLTLRTDSHRLPSLQLIKEGYRTQDVHLQRNVSPLVFINFLNPIGYAVDYFTGTMYELVPARTRTGLEKLNPAPPDHRSSNLEEDLEKLDAPPEVVVAASTRFWWVHTYSKTYEDCRILKRVGDTLVLGEDRGAETHVPLQEVYSISSERKKTDFPLVLAGLWTVAGAYVGSGAGLLTGAMVFPKWGFNSSHNTAVQITAGLGAVLGAVKGLLLRPDEEGPPEIQAMMADWPLDKKRNWLQINVLQ